MDSRVEVLNSVGKGDETEGVKGRGEEAAGDGRRRQQSECLPELGTSRIW